MTRNDGHERALEIPFLAASVLYKTAKPNRKRTEADVLLKYRNALVEFFGSEECLCPLHRVIHEEAMPLV